SLVSPGDVPKRWRDVHVGSPRPRRGHVATQHRTCSWLHGTLPDGASRPMDVGVEQPAVPAPPEQLVLCGPAPGTADIPGYFSRRSTGAPAARPPCSFPGLLTGLTEPGYRLPNRNGVCRAALRAWSGDRPEQGALWDPENVHGLHKGRSQRTGSVGR